MSRRIKLADVNQAALADADDICAVDPNVPGYFKQIWRLNIAADPATDAVAAEPQPAANALEIELDSVDPGNLLRLESMVKEVKEPFLEATWDLDDNP
jgi:hypothetical protein